MISFSEALPVEMQLWVLADLIYSRDFPSSLIRFSQGNQDGLILGRDNQIWRQAIRFYFPYIEALAFTKEPNVNEGFKDNAYQHFKTLYKRCSSILKSENIAFSDYVKAMLNEWRDIPVEKHAVLIGLSVAAGQQKVFSHDQLSLAKNYTLLFSAALGNKTTFINVMNDAVPPTDDFKRRAMIVTSEYGFLSLCTHLLSHANAALDRKTLSDAFLNACTFGYIKIVQVFLSQPLVQTLTFYLAKALYLACMHGKAAIVVELLKNAHLKANHLALKDATRSAVTFSHLGPLEVLLQEVSLAKDNLLMIDLLKMSVERSNADMTAMILAQAKVNFPLIVILDAIQRAIDNEDDKTALAILKGKMQTISPYARRNILYSSAEKGRAAIVDYLLENDPKTFNSQNIGQALRLAASNHHTELVISLMQKSGDKICESDKKYIMSMPCYASSILLRMLSGIGEIEELTSQFEHFSLEDATKSEGKENVCLMQFGSVKACVKSIDDRIKQQSQSFKKRF